MTNEELIKRRENKFAEHDYELTMELIDEVLELRALIHDLQEEKGLLPSIKNAVHKERERCFIFVSKLWKKSQNYDSYSPHEMSKLMEKVEELPTLIKEEK